MPQVMKTMSAPFSRLYSSSAILRRPLRPVGIAARAQAAGELVADAHAHRRLTEHERLLIGVDGDELNPGQAFRDHPIDGILATATDADHFDLSRRLSRTL